MSKNTGSLFIIILIVLSGSCQNSNTPDDNVVKDTTSNNPINVSTALPQSKNFQSTIDSKQTNLYVIKNKKLLSVAITNYGARIVSILVRDRSGNLTDVAVGYDAIKPYTEGSDTYFGAIVGRYGNRIANGRFKLGGKEYILATNNGKNHLHGGTKGFSREVWDAQQPNDSTLILTYLSKDGEEGYPGNLNVKVSYAVTFNNELIITYEATTDKSTVLNVTNHTYFNLNGQGSGTINDHVVSIYADNYTPVDSTLIPTGKIETVKQTPFDFTEPVSIGSRINDTSNIQLKYGKGYDHNFVLNSNGNIKVKAAEAAGDKTGIVMDVYTTQPGLQFYGGNFMDGTHNIKAGKKDEFRTAFCMETQHFPDSPNQNRFPSTTLRPGNRYSATTIYAFSVKP